MKISILMGTLLGERVFLGGPVKGFRVILTNGACYPPPRQLT